MSQSKNNSINAKKTFKEKGTCSRTFAYILNSEFGNKLENEESATDSLAGGVMRKGHQCGMLWGSALAIGAEAYRKSDNADKAKAMTILATQKMMESFVNRTNTVNCKEITGCSMDNFFGLAKYMIKVTLKGMDNSICFNLAENWAPEAIQSAKEGLSIGQDNLFSNTENCASKVVEKLGGSEEEITMIAGFAGGLGLSGNGCGALSAAIWMNSLQWAKENPGKSTFNNPRAKNSFKAFCIETGNEMLCHKICGQEFLSIEDHSEFIKLGGCKKLIDTLSAI